MPMNLQGLQFTIQKNERCISRQEFVCMNDRETSHLYQFHRIQVLLLNVSKEFIIKFSNEISAINKSWKLSVLKKMDGPCVLIMILSRLSGLQVNRFQVLTINNILVEAASESSKCQ